MINSVEIAALNSLLLSIEKKQKIRRKLNSIPLEILFYQNVIDSTRK